MEIKGIKLGNLTSKLPIVQGGMGVGVSRSQLAGTVAKYGGIGTISAVGIGFGEEDYYTNPLMANLRALRKEINKAREIAPEGILGLNILVAVQNYKEIAMEAVKSGIDLIVSGAGLPLELPEIVQGSQTKIAPIVSSGKVATLLCKRWSKRYDRLPDMIVVEGQEAGGHLGFKMDELVNHTARKLEDLVVEVVEAVKVWEEQYNVKIPVVAAGGIYTGADIGRFLDLGAAGAQIGTRFIGTDECDAHDNYKQAFIHAKKEDIQLVKSPVGMPGRAIRNKFVEKVEQGQIKVKQCVNCLIPCDPLTTPYCISEALINAVKGDVDNGLIFTGSNGYRINEIVPVKSILDELMGELKAYMEKK